MKPPPYALVALALRRINFGIRPPSLKIPVVGRIGFEPMKPEGIRFTV
jgi:hypothetical protein